MIRLRLSESLVGMVRDDLHRPHPFALERVGFLCCRQSGVPSGRLLLAYKYVPVCDDHYIRDDSVGARFDAAAIRMGMQLALAENAAVFHLHLHSHVGLPRFSRVDTREMSALMPCFVNVCPIRLHGALVLSEDRACARVWGVELPSEGTAVTRITEVGSSVRVLS
jgi:hypothetical protein